MCFTELEDVDLIHEEVWDGMTLGHRVALMHTLGLEGKLAAKSYDMLPEEELAGLMNKHCPGCNTDWSVEDLATATSTPLQLDCANHFG
jgi:hypothetical protein